MSSKTTTVAYVPFKTFLAAIERFEHRMPNQIDGSLWPSYSGAIRSQLLGSFKFLGLIDDQGRPTSSLKAMVDEVPRRKVHLKRILESSYKPVVAIGLQNATPKQFREAIDQFGGMTGATRKKVVSFFLGAAKYCELPLAPSLLSRTRSSAVVRKKLVNERQSGPPGDHAQSSVTSKVVELSNGQTLTVALSGSALDLTPTDRNFVFEVIDKLRGYKRRTV